MTYPDAVQDKISCTVSCTNTGTGEITNPEPFLVTKLVVCHPYFLYMGWMAFHMLTHYVGQVVLCQVDFLYAGQMAMHTPTFLHI